ncbi:MAG: SLC13 family permease [Verrucomicrobiota bacterium JB022]|nr:SLC13 family permease [Verrucomicrobiota bacterium JB022]
MTWEIPFMLMLLVAILVSFALEKIPAELTAMTAFALLLVLGLLPMDKAMAVFSNSGPITVAAMFILSAGLEKCGAIDYVAAALNRLPPLKLYMVLPVMIVGVAAISAFINNTPVVVVFLPVAFSLAQRLQVPASKLLIPLSYASIFGGSCTLIGTSTNIIVSSMARDAGHEPIGMFELATVGLPLLVAGTLYLTLLGPKILPTRETISSILTEEERREYMLEAYVKADSSLVGKTLPQTSLGKVENLRILEILRHGVRLRHGTGEMVFQAGDRLLLAMSPRAVSKAQQAEGLDLRDTLGDGLEQISLSQGVMVEAVIGPDSELIGQTLSHLNFRQRYRLAPMAVHRRGKNLHREFDKVALDRGDILLLLGTTEAIDNARGSEDLLILDRPPVILGARRRKLPFILAVIACVIGSASIGLMPIAGAAMVGCVVLLLAKCLTMKEAYEAIQWPILFIIFAMLGVGAAMEATGTSAWLADHLVAGVGAFVPEAWQPFALLAGIYLLTTILTEILSNNAAAVLLTAIALGLAHSMQLDPRPFLIAIAIAASASFATPIGYQTNTYVYGVGGYRFSDFAKIGIPLNLLAFVIAMAVIPMVWSF